MIPKNPIEPPIHIRSMAWENHSVPGDNELPLLVNKPITNPVNAIVAKNRIAVTLDPALFSKDWQKMMNAIVTWVMCSVP